MALVNGCYLHYTDMKKFLKNVLSKDQSDFEKNSQECPLGDPFQNFSSNFDPSINMALVNGGYLHYTDIFMVLSKIQVSDPGPSWPSCFS